MRLKFKTSFLKGVTQRCVTVTLCAAAVWAGGCMNPTEHRQKADRKAQDIIAEKHLEALGREGSIAIDRPSTILRRRLLEEQGLVVSGPASLGSDRLERVEHWPDDEYLMSDGESADAFGDSARSDVSPDDGKLQIGPRDSFQ